MGTFFGDPFDTAELTNTAKSIKGRPNRNIVLKATRTWLIFNDFSGSFTNLTMKVYSDRNGSPGALIATSTNSWTKSQIITQNSGVKEVYFEFDLLPMRSNLYYHFVLNCSGYTGSTSSHIAWRKAWPDPVYRTGWSQTFESLGVSPYFLTVIGAEL